MIVGGRVFTVGLAPRQADDHCDKRTDRAMLTAAISSFGAFLLSPPIGHLVRVLSREGCIHRVGVVALPPHIGMNSLL